MADAPCLEDLEIRLKEIEKRVGIQNKDSGQIDVNRKVEDIISEAQKRLKDAEAKSSVLGKVFKQLKPLDYYLSAEFFQKLNVTAEASADIVISGEKKIQNSVKQLEEIGTHKDIINQKKLNDFSELNSQLQPLVQVQMQQSDEYEELNKQLNNLLSAYNNIISSISKQFVQWDSVLTQCELAVDAKQADIDS